MRPSGAAIANPLRDEGRLDRADQESVTGSYTWFSFELPPFPPKAKIFPSTTAVPRLNRGVVIGVLVVQVLVAGSYRSTVPRLEPFRPPMTYNWPFTTPAAAPRRAVDMGASTDQTSAAGS